MDAQVDQSELSDATTTCIDCLGVVSPDDKWYHWVVCPEAQLVLSPAPSVGARVTIDANGEEMPTPLPAEAEILAPTNVEMRTVSPNPSPELLAPEERLSPPRNWIPRHLWDHQYGQRSVCIYASIFFFIFEGFFSKF